MTTDLNPVDAELRAEIERAASALCNDWLLLEGGKGSKLSDKMGAIRANALTLIERCDFSPPNELKRLLRVLLTVDPVTLVINWADGDDLPREQRKAIACELALASVQGAKIVWGVREMVARLAGVEVSRLDKWRGEDIYSRRRESALISGCVNDRLDWRSLATEDWLASFRD